MLDTIVIEIEYTDTDLEPYRFAIPLDSAQLASAEIVEHCLSYQSVVAHWTRYSFTTVAERADSLALDNIPLIENAADLVNHIRNLDMAALTEQ